MGGTGPITLVLDDKSNYPLQEPKQHLPQHNINSDAGGKVSREVEAAWCVRLDGWLYCIHPRAPSCSVHTGQYAHSTPRLHTVSAHSYSTPRHSSAQPQPLVEPQENETLDHTAHHTTAQHVPTNHVHLHTASTRPRPATDDDSFFISLICSLSDSDSVAYISTPLQLPLTLLLLLSFLLNPPQWLDHTHPPRTPLTLPGCSDSGHSLFAVTCLLSVRLLLGRRRFVVRLVDDAGSEQDAEP